MFIMSQWKCKGSIPSYTRTRILNPRIIGVHYITMSVQHVTLRSSNHTVIIVVKTPTTHHLVWYANYAFTVN